MAEEKAHLLEPAPEGFPLSEAGFGRVDGKGCVKVRGNWYSAPLPAGAEARVEVSAAWIEIHAHGQAVARHTRCYGHGRQILNLEHYLDVLWRKPGALPGSTALAQWRAQGRWPECYDRLWREFEKRQGKAAGTRALIEMLELGRRWGHERLTAAVKEALQLGLSDAAAVRHLMGAPAPLPATLPAARKEAGRWASYERPLPTLEQYDLLLAAGRVQ